MRDEIGIRTLGFGIWILACCVAGYTFTLPMSFSTSARSLQ
jgi:hypothetical protein